MARNARRDLLNSPVAPTIIRLAAPMTLGILAIHLFNVVDTFWVSRLGTEALTAMAFTFPVTLVVHSVAMGLGLGATAVIARAIGGGDQDRVKRLTTDLLLLASAIAIVIIGVGLMAIEPLFLALGARISLIPLIREYIEPWYWGSGFLTLAVAGNSAIRAAGDTLRPGLIMTFAGIMNVVLDPLLIFGLGPIPGFGLAGAAIATAITYGAALLATMSLLIWRERLVSFVGFTVSELCRSWRAVMTLAVPATGTNMLFPLHAGLLTRIVSMHGESAVAAWGVGTRVEALSMVVCGALASGMVSFVGQNAGAQKWQRIRHSLLLVIKWVCMWGILCAILLGFQGDFIGSIFDDSTAVTDAARGYFVIIPLSYAPLAIGIVIATTFNALHLPWHAAGIVAVRFMVLSVPLAYLGSALFGLYGIFIAVAIANVVNGGFAWCLIAPRVKRWKVATGSLPGPQPS